MVMYRMREEIIVPIEFDSSWMWSDWRIDE